MWTLLSAVAGAATCCTATGIEPLALGSCERLAVITSASSEARTGTWRYDRGWSSHGAEPLPDSVLSVGVAGRIGSRITAGLRVPLLLTLEPESRSFGMGHLYPWAQLAAHSGEHARIGVFAGLGSLGPTLGVGPGARLVEAGPTAWVGGERGFVAVRATASVPVVGAAPTGGDAVVEGGLGAGGWLVGGRLDGGLDVYGAGSTSFAASDVRAGPSLWTRVRGPDRWQVSLVASPPLKGFGSNAGSTAKLEVSWLHAM